jgi:pimeloyl-ACP methyl ester carboxylesterase
LPLAHRDGIALYYESTGAGAPVLLIMGLGMNATGWWRTVPVLANAGLRVIAFDNRGVGRSDRPAGPYSVAEMADDAVAVLDACEIDRANVYGISLGGMVAQEIALRHPARVDRLVLGATTPGGQAAVPADPAVLEFFARRAEMTAADAVRASVQFNYAARTRAQHPERINEDIVERLRYPIEPDPYRAQLAAALAHDAGDRLRHIGVATMVIHGVEDRMVPYANAEVLVERIRGARLELLPNAAHLYPTDDVHADGRVAAFLNAD